MFYNGTNMAKCHNFGVERMYSGDFRISLDDRARMRIPTKLKKMLGDSIVMTAGTDGCAFLMNEDDLDAFLRPIRENVKLSDHERTNMLRKFYATIYHLTEDKQGRYILPLKLRKYIRAEKDLVFLGAGDRIEVWAEEVYDQLFEGSVEEINEVIDFLGM